MKIQHLHDWDLSPKAAAALQKELAPRLSSQVPLELDRIGAVAGVDVSVKGGFSRAAVVVMSFPGLEILEVVRATRQTSFPYVPGLLAFREGPAVLAGLRQLQSAPDVFLFDGMGQIHPRRMGIAAHLGLWLERPTVGCGKTHFIGEYDQPAAEKGSWRPLYFQGAQLGVVLRTRTKVKPVYVSVGHLATLAGARALVLRCVTRYRLPEPIRAAHKAASLQGT